MVSALFAFLATYVVHSSVFLLLAEVASRTGRLTPSGRDVLWKAALVGGIVSALFASTFAPRAETMTFSIPSTARVQEATDPATAAASAAIQVRSDREPGTSPPNREISLEELVVSFWLLGALILLGRLLIQQRRAARRLAPRARVSSGRLAAELSALSRRTGLRRPIRLSVAPFQAIPLALGFSEICVPERFLTDLRPKEREAALAHELAHLVRRDPLWNVIAHVLEALLFVQPLNRLATSRMRSAAELCCDDWAARQLGSGTDLARSLAVIASWVNDSRIAARLVIAIAGDGAPLALRIERLLRGPSARTVVPVTVFLALAFVATTVLAPAVRPPRITPSIVSEGTPNDAGHYSWRGPLVSGSVEVKTPMGDVRFSRSSTAEVEIDAVAVGRERHEVRFVVLEHERGLTVCAVFPPTAGMPENRCDPGPWRVHGSTTKARADIHVKLPPGIGAATHSMTGNVVVSSPPADALIRTETGSIALLLEQQGWRGRADLRNGSGDITIRHSRAEGVQVDALSLHGRVEADLPLGGPSTQRSDQPFEGLHGDVFAGGSVRARSDFGKIDLRAW